MVAEGLAGGGFDFFCGGVPIRRGAEPTQGTVVSGSIGVESLWLDATEPENFPNRDQRCAGNRGDAQPRQRDRRRVGGGHA